MIALTWAEGRIEFSGFALPDRLTLGGEQALAVHRMLGGRRQIQALGPDDAPIEWQARFLDEFAELKCAQLDLLRRSGRQVQLTVATRAYKAVVQRFVYTMLRPQLFEYQIALVVAEDQVLGDGGRQSASLEQEIAADLAAAEAYAAARDQVLYGIAIASTAVRAAMGDRGALRGLTSVALAEAQGAVGQAVFAATGQAAAADAAVAAVGGVGGVMAGGDPAQMALNFLGTTAAVEAASSIGLAAAHMSRVQGAVAAAPA